MADLKTLHSSTTVAVLHELELFFDEQIHRAESKDEVLAEMTRVLKEFTLRGGKRIRPFLTVLGYEYAQKLEKNTSEKSEKISTSPKNTGNIYRLASAVEVHHNYILNLDDMADRDILRHGGPTLERYYQEHVFSAWKDADHHGRTFSSIAGALLNSFTFELLRTSEFSSKQIVAILQVITNELFADTVAGWTIHYFQNNEQLAETSRERFLKGLDFVTSRYTFVGPLKVGLLAGGLTSQKDKATFEIFEKFGRSVGTAFQIQDDIIGLYGDPKVTGKAVGNDVREGKKTLLMQFAYQHSNPEDKQFLAEVIGKPITDEQLAKIQEIIQSTGALQFSQNLAKEKVTAGIEELKKLELQTVDIEVLEELAQYIISRDK